MTHVQGGTSVGRAKDGETPTVFIWGMGLIGASLGLALRKAGYVVKGSVRSAKSHEILRQMGFEHIFTGETEALREIRNSDFLALGLNLPDCYHVLDLVLGGSLSRENLVIFDMCSTKREICDYVGLKYPNARFIGAHPMAGKETQGPAAAEAGLFEGSTVFLTPPSGDAAEIHKAVADLWLATGAQVAVLPADRHDHTMAYVSHGLHLNACLIAELSADIREETGNISPAAGSYRDMTRIAQSPGEMWQDIIRSNKTNVAAWLRKLASRSEELANALEKGEADITGLFNRARKNRSEIMRM